MLISTCSHCELSHLTWQLTCNNPFSTVLGDVSLEKSTIYVMENDKTEVLCIRPKGSPEPSITWLKADSQPLPKRFGVKGCCTLLNNKTRLNDDGEYTCTAKNIFGTSSKTVKIIVSGELIQYSLQFHLVYWNKYHSWFCLMRLMISRLMTNKLYMWPLHYRLNWDILETLVFDERKTREAMEKPSE